VLYGRGASLACGLDGQVNAEALHGLFAGDTRVLSTYRIALNGAAWQLLGRERFNSSMARWTYQNPTLSGPDGKIAEGTLLFSLQRQVIGALRDDLCILAFPEHPIHVRLTLQLDSDFADIFQVKDQSLPPRLNIARIAEKDGLSLVYKHGGFHRALQLRLKSSSAAPEFLGSLVIFELNLAPGATWCLSLEATPIIDHKIWCFAGGAGVSDFKQLVPLVGPDIESARLLQDPFTRGLADLHALAIPQTGHPPYPAAGVPWFFTLFGRDTLVTSLMSGLDGSWKAEGTLAALGERQATQRDDWRDAEPGKLPHEIRSGELSYEEIIPHSAYYGTHDAPALYCLTLWQTWRWTGKAALLDAHCKTAEAALRWCDQLGDRDGDGLLEYATRSQQGYYNQGWKDAGDAILDTTGALAKTPLATVELQGYLYAARLAMAELLAERGDLAGAEKLRQAAERIRGLVEELYWMEDQGFYALALDGNKRQVRSIASNPGHLLWCGLPSRDRASRVASRLLEPDMYTGWGLRSLSAKHAAYNPLSYQRGSVWPFDTALAAAGLWRYGLREAASTLLRAILEAAVAFELERLPELFCGLDRSFGLPVPYLKANTPQAWSAAVPVLAAQLFLGLVPDAARGRCYLSPWLPDWLPTLKMRRIAVGPGTLDITLARTGDETVIVDIHARDIEIVKGTTTAPLWGNPARSPSP